MTTVRDVMSGELVTVDPEATVAEAATVMGGRHVGSALVCETVPGKGVPSFEMYEKVHYIRAAPEVWRRALEELAPRG